MGSNEESDRIEGGVGVGWKMGMGIEAVGGTRTEP